MEFILVAENGAEMPLEDNEKFWLTGIDAQTSVATSIASSVVGGIDGDTVNNIQANPRTIVLDLVLNPSIDIEASKRYILGYVKPKKRMSLKWERLERVAIISGYVESIEMPRWTSDVMVQITMHCDDPFWADVENVVQEISETIALHYFTDNEYDQLIFPDDGIPFSSYDTTRTKTFTNAGDVSVGMDILITAFATVTNPIIYAQNGDFFGVGYGDGAKQIVLEEGDTVVITTGRGNKTVKMDGINIFDKIKPNSTWLQLESGVNTFSINSDDESITNMTFSLTFRQKYV